MRNLLLAGFVAPLAVIACGGAQSPSADEAPASMPTLSADEATAEPMVQGTVLGPLERLEGQHIAGIAVGTDAAQVQELLGSPETIDADGEVMAATGTTFETWDYPAQGLSVTMERAHEDSAWVAWITATAPWGGVMPCGLYLGMSESDARLVLGEETRFMDEDAWATLSAIVEDGLVIGLVFSQMGE